MSLLTNQVFLTSFLGIGFMLIFTIYMIWFMWHKSKPNKDNK